MKIMIFGATGMVGQGVLRECLLAADVQTVLLVGRRPGTKQHAKLRELVHPDLFDLKAVRDKLVGYDACFFCLGVSSAGMSEEDYRRMTFELTLDVAELLAERNPGMIFTYVSGQGTDNTERGKVMWARVKGKTENKLLRLPFKAAYMFRPGIIQPLHGARSKTRSYRLFYLFAAPFLPLARHFWPDQILTTEQVGRAMLTAARNGAPK
ncbi:MAG TPA: NAD-dependent epimerase/dehydratase family protein, partial [Gammaproteobacteria bacterium]|nr:NAD-dependent epimerase/dehydratase family protein [Gammaproteobacteria bacterium]